MAKKTVIVVSACLAVAAIILIVVFSVVNNSSNEEHPTIRHDHVQNETHILRGEVCPCPGDCVQGYTCLPTKDCYDKHAASSLRESLVKVNCSASEEYVCCPHVPKISKTEIRDPEMNKRLLPLDDCGQIGVPRIIGGEKAGPGQFPWMALLAYRPNGTTSGAIRYLCGGTLISTRYILTAAHCVNIKGFGKPVHVRLGELDLSTKEDCVPDLYCAAPPVDVGIEKFITHKKYNKPFLKNDIALLRLNTAIDLSQFTLPICLPFGINITGDEETEYDVAGWGKTDDISVKGSDSLLFTTVQSIPIPDCNAAMPAEEVKPINELQLCAGATGETDACRGDSGGPMMTNINDHLLGSTTTYQIGIVSFGSTHCGSEIPSVYTRVTSYLGWILANLEP